MSLLWHGRKMNIWSTSPNQKGLISWSWLLDILGSRDLSRQFIATLTKRKSYPKWPKHSSERFIINCPDPSMGYTHQYPQVHMGLITKCTIPRVIFIINCPDLCSSYLLPNKKLLIHSHEPWLFPYGERWNCNEKPSYIQVQRYHCPRVVASWIWLSSYPCLHPRYSTSIPPKTRPCFKTESPFSFTINSWGIHVSFQRCTPR